MDHDTPDGTDRRRFLQQAGTLAAASAALGSAPAAALGQDPDRKPMTLSRRPLGKTGVDVTILDQGTGKGRDVDRLLRFGFARGVRFFDTSETYHSEPAFKKWFEQAPEVRKQIFLVTKDTPKTPGQLPGMVDKRIAALGTDYVDLIFIHSFGDNHSLDDAINYVKSKELKEAAEAVKKSGKARFVGISTHHKDRAQLIRAAAEGGIVDAIMLQYRPWLDKDSPLNKALDFAHEKGVGLISMKQIAGTFLGDKPRGNLLDDVVRRVPTLKERNLTPFQGLLHAIWSDERLSAVCVSMNNTDHIRDNTDAAQRYNEPLKEAEIRQVRDAVLAHNPMLCADCDGRCMTAAGTQAELGNLTRFLTYYEHHGLRAEARRQYADLPPEAKDWSGADLDAARAACPNRLDFARLLREVDRRLA
jgi:predicted aldo/keto reductase-like oxidoreductase